MNLYIKVLTDEGEKLELVRVGIDQTNLDDFNEVSSLVKRLRSVIFCIKQEIKPNFPK